MSLKNLIATDIKSVFLGDAEDYGEALKIGISSSNVVNTFGSLQNNLIDNNTGTNPYNLMPGCCSFQQWTSRNYTSASAKRFM